jgi:regulatory protein
MGFSRLSLKARALRLLAQREHSRSELQAKLARHMEEGEDLPALLDALEAQGLVSAQRVAESVVHQRAARFGTRRVAQELRAKGLDEDLVRATAAQLASTELERARAVWRQRFGSAPPPATSQERARQMRFLAARGFAAEVVRRVVRGGDEEFE